MKNLHSIFSTCFLSMFLSLSGGFLAISTAYGAAYNVNSLADAGTGAGVNGDFRYCINQANAAVGPHTITFSVTGTINLTSTLPVFTRQITVTATPGNIVLNGGNVVNWVFFFNNAGAASSILDGLVINRAGTNYANIEINGVNTITVRNCYIGTNAAGNAAAASNPNFGITLIGSSNCVIQNNVISGHLIHGLLINNASNGTAVRGNKIGCNLAGTAAIPNGVHGIELNNASINAIIGGNPAADRNIISGNTNSGISVVGGSTGIQINNNYIGTTLAGTGALSNGEHGVVINGSANATLTNNVISGNQFFGVHILTCNGHTIRGNKIGTNTAGTGAIPNAFVGLRLENSDNAIIGGATAGQGNTCSGNGEEGVLLINCDNANIKGNFVGTNATGAGAVANGRSGFHLQFCATPTIGGLAAGDGNTISGNAWDGINFENSADAIIQGNYIGTNTGGTAAVSNGGSGIAGYTNSTNHMIGGPNVAARNIISGNNVDGIHYDGISGACSDLTIQNNYIGTNASGTGAAALGNGKSGVEVSNGCLRTLIGGTTTTVRNIISNNGRLWGGVGNGTGIVVKVGCHNATITANYIGLAVDGATALGNQENGIVIGYSNNVTIGGNNATLRNLISSNGKQGIVLSADPGTVITGTIIRGNYCGTDVTGTLVRGNGQSGLVSIFANGGAIGGVAAGEGNIFSNNSEHGIHLIGGSGNLVYNNLIGVAVNGTTAMGNKNGGVYIQGVGGGTHGSNNTIGGLGASQANTIAYSTNTGADPTLGNGFGVGVAHNQQGRQNTIIGNKIFCNAGLGIDLDFTGAFGGANNQPGNGGKPAPALTGVTATSTSGTGINGETIHVYSNVTCTTCQGEVYLGSAVVAGGVWTVTHASVAVPSNNSATATSAALGTSEFTCNYALPVALIYFKAKAQGDVALLTWATGTEKNNAGFAIERSVDGIHFEQIGYQEGKGNTQQLSNYSYTDYTPLNGVSYYRLKQIDYDGTTTYSSLQSVTFNSNKTFYVFPNPAQDQLNVVLEGDQEYSIHVYTNLGVELKNLHIERNGATFSISLNGVASGSYILEVHSENAQFTKQFLVY